jgi:hypothetical protein
MQGGGTKISFASNVDKKIQNIIKNYMDDIYYESVPAYKVNQTIETNLENKYLEIKIEFKEIKE